MTDITELTSVQKNANIHRLSTLIAYASNDELRQMAVEVEIYTDRLIEALEKAQRYIEELREWNAGLAQESFERQQRISELLEGKVGNALRERESHHVEVVGKLTEHINQLESRTVKLPDDEDGQAYGFGKWANGKLPATAGAMTIAYCEDAWRAAFEVFSSTAGIKVEADSLDADVSNRNQPGMVVAVHIDVGDFVKFRGQVYEVKETDFDDHDVTLWFVCGEALKCAAGCQIEVVSALGETE
ncbi:hypothetical protein [Klebsiella pneumoniae]|uniref:hypothetical protein n=1 Tax=Klebsiella pneumoniae TaxID=573 RepID=UPI0010D51C40|nr:hypothetical protein [Klebsiella pneumoniae]VGA71776.1 Uncharacterised protein [Klebsiella pneumoniae]